MAIDRFLVVKLESLLNFLEKAYVRFFRAFSFNQTAQVETIKAHQSLSLSQASCAFLNIIHLSHSMQILFEFATRELERLGLVHNSLKVPNAEVILIKDES